MVGGFLSGGALSAAGTSTANAVGRDVSQSKIINPVIYAFVPPKEEKFTDKPPDVYVLDIPHEVEVLAGTEEVYALDAPSDIFVGAPLQLSVRPKLAA